MDKKELIERMNNKMKKENVKKVPVKIIDDGYNIKGTYAYKDSYDVDKSLLKNRIENLKKVLDKQKQSQNEQVVGNEKIKSDKELIDKLNNKLGCDIAKGKDKQSFTKIDYSPDDKITLMPYDYDSPIEDKQTESLGNRLKNFVIKTRIQEIRNYIQSIEELLTDIEDYLK